jgi:hypothetical protein
MFPETNPPPELTSEEQRRPEHVEGELRIVQLKGLIGLLPEKA